MGTLRERLRAAAPELHSTLERSWHTAHEEWLPAIPLSKTDSFNSYPHLRNLEAYLEQIVAEYESLNGPSAPPLLSPFEMYVVLASILFHDIGRVADGDDVDHGCESQKIVTRDYASLGIPSKELAESIGRIVEFHTKTPEMAASCLSSELSTVVVSPFGAIRERALAALLVLVDHMDSAFTRVPPQYVSDHPAGSFRRATRGVS
jgi:hypothetical protein